MNIKKLKQESDPGELCLINIRAIMQVLSGKWKMEIVWFLLRNGKKRFMDVQRGVPGISARVLSKELQELQKNQIVSRTVNDPKLTSVEYELTEHGKQLETVLQSITRWGDVHLRYLSLNG